MAVWLIGWFARNAANVNRQTSVKTTPLSLFQLVCVCLSEWIWEREGERVKSCFRVFVFRCSYVCLCVRAENHACMLDGEGSTLHDADKYTFANSACTLGWTEQRHTRLCIGMASLSWLRCSFNLLGIEIAPSFVLISKSCDSEIWFLLWSALTWNVEWFDLDFGLERFWSWMGSTLDELRLNCIFKYLDFTVRVHDVNQLQDTNR